MTDNIKSGLKPMMMQLVDQTFLFTPSFWGVRFVASKDPINSPMHDPVKKYVSAYDLAVKKNKPKRSHLRLVTE